MPKSAIETSVLLNHNAKHHIKTKTGITKEHYQSTHDYPSFGKGQGKGSSLSNWLFQVSTLLMDLHSLCTGVRLFSVWKTKKAERMADAYVDNMGNAYVDKDKHKDETPTTICDNIEHIAQTWEQLLYSSGGKLCPKKTF
eukprot:7548385-Ditylum_brightwellii.AAC.1